VSRFVNGCVVSFSGGVESTALLQYCKSKEDNVVALYSHCPKSQTQAKQIPENLEKICNLLDVELIVHTHQDYGTVDQLRYFYSTRHWVLALCNASMRFPFMKNFYWGANSGLIEFDDGLGDCSIVDPTKYHIQTIFETLQNIPRKIDGYHDSDAKNPDGSYKTHIDHKFKQTISAPLIGWTKKKQWDYIREDVKEYVQSCFHFTNCGTCPKCEEFKLMINKNIL